MASTIKIKRSGTTEVPSSGLGSGELAYSWKAGVDRLYIGYGSEIEGYAENIAVIGGKYFTDLLGATPGTVSAGMALLVDNNKKLNELLVDNIRIDGNAITSTNINGNIELTPNGIGKVSIANSYTLPNADGTAGQLLVTNGSGAISFQSPAPSSFTITGNTGTDVFSTGDTLSVTGTGPIGVAVTDNAIAISVADASTTTKGVASFADASFAVASGAVTIKTGGVLNSQLANSSITIGTSSVSLGGTITTIDGLSLSSLTVDNLEIDNNTISAVGVAADININFVPKGTGVVDVGTSRITNVATPSDAFDAVNKQYVDEVAQGLKALPAAWGATTADLDATYADGPDAGNPGVGSTLTATTNVAFPQVDGIETWEIGKNILVKDQTIASQNGSYVITDMGETGVSPWVLTRCDFCDEPDEVQGAYEFVTYGIVNGGTGWVLTVANGATIVIGTTPLIWVQFSGAGTFLAGDGLDLNGTVFSVNTGTGLEIVGDNVQIDSAYIGQTSITTLGTVTTGEWQGSIIGATYGGTGVNNGSNTITIGGNVTLSGAHAFTGTLTGATTVTFPTTGTLVTLSGTEALTNKSIDGSTIGLVTPGAAAFTSLAASGIVTLTNTTDATALGTAAVVLSGGLSIAKKMYIGDNLIGDDSELIGFIVDGGTY